jgi:hypothetical protein
MGGLIMFFTDKGAHCIINGLVALSLSLLVWSLTGSVWGQYALSLPGGMLVFYGWYLILKDE